MFKIKYLDVTVATLAALSCLLMFLEVPLWAVFIGWAWYYTLGSSPIVFKQATPSMIVGALLAVLGYILIDAFSPLMPMVAATALAVFITVFLLMMALKIPMCSVSLVAFNAYSSFFVGYAAHTFMVVEGMPSLLNGLIWITGGNFIGLIFGWLSISIVNSFEKSSNPS